MNIKTEFFRDETSFSSHCFFLLFTAKVRIRSQTSRCDICGGQSCRVLSLSLFLSFIHHRRYVTETGNKFKENTPFFSPYHDLAITRQLKSWDFEFRHRMITSLSERSPILHTNVTLIIQNQQILHHLHECGSCCIGTQPKLLLRVTQNT